MALKITTQLHSSDNPYKLHVLITASEMKTALQCPFCKITDLVAFRQGSTMQLLDFFIHSFQNTDHALNHPNEKNA